MVSSAIQPETATFFRRSELAGVELRCIDHSARNWRCYSTGFEFMVPSSWHGEIWHRNRLIALRPGYVLCTQPGDVIAAQRVTTPGRTSSLLLDARVLHTYLAEHDVDPGQLKLHACVKLSAGFAQALAGLFESLSTGGAAAELQQRMRAVVEGVLDELLDAQESPAVALDGDTRAAQRVRAWLDDDPSGSVDLGTLAGEIGMSRFRALRLFKRCYGLPPHTYQLHLRLGLAQKSLREGAEPAQVAAEYGFVDQSHLTRHFKRLLGVTPARYARIGSATR